MRKANKSVIMLSGAAGAAVVAALAAVASAQTPTSAGQSPEVLARVYACTATTNDAERLACYDAAVGALKSAQAKGEITTIDKAQAKAIERESFGFNLPSLPKLAFPDLFGGGDAPAPTAEVKGVIRRVGGQSKPIFTLDNGQVWQSVDSDTNRNAREGASVTIRRGLSNSYLMSVETGGTALRVRRVE